MPRSTITTLLTAAALLMAIAAPAGAHVGIGATSSFGPGFAHPFSGLDHIAAMVAVGLWAGLKGGPALWLWPAAFVAVMLAGGALAIAGVELPLVEPGILASIVAVGLLVALAVELPVAAGAAIVGGFALFHGHAHGDEMPATSSGLAYFAGFGLATTLLLGVGMASAIAGGLRHRPLIRLAGGAVSALGVGLFVGAF